MAGGGRSSARETIGRVAAGAIAKKLLRMVAGVEVSSKPCLKSSQCFLDTSDVYLSRSTGDCRLLETYRSFESVRVPKH